MSDELDRLDHADHERGSDEAHEAPGTGSAAPAKSPAPSMLSAATASLGAGVVQRKLQQRAIQRKTTAAGQDAAPAAAATKKPLDKQGQYIMRFGRGAVALENKDGVPALFTLAQGALESGWGEHAIGNALFGIKAGSGWKGKKQLVKTVEYFKDDKQGGHFPEVISITKVDSGPNAGKYKYVVKDWFRDYDTVEEGLADHSNFLMDNKRYAPAFATETPEAFAMAVAKAGYATAGGYGETLKSIIGSVRKHWPADLGAIPPGNAKAKTGGKPHGHATTPTDGKDGGKDNGPSGGDKTPPGTNPSDGKTPDHTRPDTQGIHASVGAGGKNEAHDAVAVKQLLIQAGYHDLHPIPDVGPRTIADIKDFQHKHLGWKHPDGLVEPGGATWKALVAAAHGGKADPGGTKAPDQGNQGGDKTPDHGTPGADKTPGHQAAGSVGAKLDQFYNDFSHIQVVHKDKTVAVVPPYHINAGDRKANALAARSGSAAVTKLLRDLASDKKIGGLALFGKAQPSDLKAILETAVARGIVAHEAGAMHDFLAKYGLSVDCSGFVSQALNFLMDGNEKIDGHDAFNPDVTGSESLEGGTANFTKVDIADVQPGDTMHVTGHIRIVNEVVHEDKIVYFRTCESTAAVNQATQMNGLMTRWWKYEHGKKSYTWKNQHAAHPAHDDKSWVQSGESNVFGRYKKLKK